MAEENNRDNLERTEEPTPRRREEARKQGQFPRSRELIPAATLLVLLIFMRWVGGELIELLGVLEVHKVLGVLRVPSVRTL